MIKYYHGEAVRGFTGSFLNNNLCLFNASFKKINQTLPPFAVMTVWQQQIFAILTPVLSGIFTYFILGEVFSYKLFLGLAIMAIGLFIALV